MRPPSRICRLLMKPWPSSPSRFSAGTRQSVKTTSDVSLARMPILFSFFPGRNPGVPFSMMKAEMPCECLSSIGDGHGHANVGVVPIGREGLRAVQHPVAAGARRHGPRAACVRSSLGLGQRPAAQFLSFAPAEPDISASAPPCRICRCGWCTANCAPQRSGPPSRPRATVPRWRCAYSM